MDHFKFARLVQYNSHVKIFIFVTVLYNLRESFSPLASAKWPDYILLHHTWYISGSKLPICFCDHERNLELLWMSKEEKFRPFCLSTLSFLVFFPLALLAVVVCTAWRTRLKYISILSSFLHSKWFTDNFVQPMYTLKQRCPNSGQWAKSSLQKNFQTTFWNFDIWHSCIIRAKCQLLLE